MERVRTRLPTVEISSSETSLGFRGFDFKPNNYKQAIIIITFRTISPY